MTRNIKALRYFFQPYQRPAVVNGCQVKGGANGIPKRFGKKHMPAKISSLHRQAVEKGQ